MELHSRNDRRVTGRPPARWSDDLIKLAGIHWIRLAQVLKERCATGGLNAVVGGLYFS